MDSHLQLWIVLLILATTSLDSYSSTAQRNKAKVPKCVGKAHEFAPIKRSTLVFVTVLFQHGDRNVLKPYRNDPFSDPVFYPEGLGQLTNVGKRQQYALGQWLRQRYKNTGILKPFYNTSDIYVRSIDYDYIMMSAEITMAGLYPPRRSFFKKSNPDWLLDQNWRPVPVHTVPADSDDSLLNAMPCAKYDQLVADWQRSIVAPQLLQYRPLINNLENRSGENIGNDLQLLKHVCDTLQVERQHGMKMPAWVQSLWNDNPALQYLMDWAFALPTQSPQLARLSYGRLLREILQRFQQKADGRLRPDRSLWVYSVDDDTLAGLMGTLGVLYPMHAPANGATLMLEQHELDGKYFIRIYYRRGWNDINVGNQHEAKLYAVPGCGTTCSLANMFQVYAKVLPDESQWEECRVEPVNVEYG